ncbi:MAG: hypothetical protein JWO06_2996, partial [Bacteroidota bacterium]|nr:hypothetical protein [Bacteroidota bacterium]
MPFNYLFLRRAKNKGSFPKFLLLFLQYPFMKQFCHNPIATGAFLISLFFTLDIDAQSSVIAQGQSLNGVPTNQILQMPVQTPVAPPAVINFQQLANFYSYPAFQPPRAITQLEDIDEDFVVEPSIIPAGAPVTIIPEGGPKALSSSPAPTGQWNGTLQNVQLIPPDIRGAASSGNWVMETNNEQFDIWNKTGTHLSTLSYDNFFSASGGSGFFDPHILYDATYNRFIVCSGGNNSSGQNAVFLAVSQTNNPTGNWYVYNVANNGQTGNGILDYPLMGYNNNWVVITARDFGSNNVTPHIYVMNRANTYAGTLGTVSNFTDNDGITLGAAQTYDATQNTEYLVSNANGNSGGNGYMKIAAITGTATAPVYSSGGNIGVNQTWGDNQGLAVGAAQSGGTTIECGDARTGNAVFINGSLWFTHTVFLPTANPTHCGVDWWQVNPVSSTVQQYGRIADATGAKYYFYPSINVNANGDALLGYCESSTSTFAGAAYSFHANFDAVNTMESDTVYKHGLANYSQTLGGGRNRYGDYSGTAMDPTDGSFWNFSEWTNTGSQWGTVVAHIPAAVIPHVPPVTNFIADVTTTCTGLVNFTDLSTGLPTSWLWNFGDGNTSTLQNPGHLYILNGTYTVQLTATNAYGSTPKIVAGYIVVNKPAGPAGTGASHCGASTFSLSASTTNHVAWRDSTGAVVSITNPFITPTLSHTTTYYVEDTIPNAAVTVGPVSNTALSATGGFFSNSTDRYLTFDAAAAFTLVSVTVYAQTAGSRIIEFRNSAGTALQTATVTLAIGTNVVTLNFNIPVGTGYELGINGASNLYRNNDGGTVNYFPFTLPGVVSITGSNAGAGFYYYFYNWQVKSGYCLSQGTAVTATINPSLVLGAGSVTNVTCNGLSNGSATVAVSGGTPTYIYHWSNSQSTATASNLAAGTFPVTITDAAGCSVTTSKTVTQPNALNVSVTPTNAGCSTPGKAVASVTGGTTAYTYSWNQGSSNGNVDSNLTAGIYLLTVTDAHSCTASVSVTISSTGGLTLSPSATNVNCFGNHTGSVSVTASGGSGTTHYTWSTTDTTQTVSNLAAGTYLVTVTEGPCSAIATQVVTQPNV